VLSGVQRALGSETGLTVETTPERQQRHYALINQGLSRLKGHSSSNSASVTLGAGGTLVFLLIAGVYYFGCESTTGQTVGKRLLDIRVKSQDGTPATTRGVAIRTVLRIIDVLPLLYLVGFVVMMVTGTRLQRLGDLAGHTFVTR
jgi:uncharacterized RDD family membrane protein YckC